MRVLASLLLFSASCGGEAPRCGEGSAPQVVTGLSGVLSGTSTIAVEIVLRSSETCASLDRQWLLWDDAEARLEVGEEPTGVLSRDNVDVDDGDRLIFFSDLGVGVRLEYPDEEIGSSLDLVIFAATDELGRARCEAMGEALTCSITGS